MDPSTKVSIEKMVFPFVIYLCERVEISLFNKSQIVEKPYGACVIRHYIGFYAMQGIIMAEFGEKKAECFRHIAISGMIFVEFITDHTAFKSTF